MNYLEIFRHPIQRVKFLVERQRTRRQLLYLNGEALEDVGITREVAQEEGSKPFWR